MPEKDLLSGVNTAEDRNNLTDTEKKHLPVIEAPDTAGAGEPISVSVDVGKLLAHPNELAHHIEYVDLYEDKRYLARVDFAAGKANPKVTLDVSLTQGGTLRAFASCNLHGVWEGVKEITIQ